MQTVYVRKPKIHMLQKGKSVCGRHWLDGEEEGSKFAGSVDCKDCLRLLTKRAPDAAGTGVFWTSSSRCAGKAIKHKEQQNV